MTDVLIVMPARAGSVGVHRKHERPVAGVPLSVRALARAVDVADRLAADGHRCDLAVTTDDPAVADRAVQAANERPDLTIHLVTRTDPELSDPATPITAPVVDLVERVATLGYTYEVVAIHQMTSATLSAVTMYGAIANFLERDDLDSASTMVPFGGLTWTIDGPDAADRRNRQLADARWLETGGLQLTRGFPRSDGWYGPDAPQIGPRHEPVEIDPDEAIDVDEAHDLAAAEIVLRRRPVAIVARGDAHVGSGHLHRAAALAAELDPYADVAVFLVDTPVELGGIVPDRWLATRFDPAEFDAIVVDLLDHPVGASIADHHGDKVVRLECDDPYCGARHHVSALRSADAVLPRAGTLVGHHLGPDWFDLRWDFIAVPASPPSAPLSHALVTFGGTDPAGHTAPVCEELRRLSVPTRALLPPALAARRPDVPDGVVLVTDANVTQEMLDASIVVTSRGRTAWEAAHLHRPVVVLAANEREATRNTVPPGAACADNPIHAAGLAAAWMATGPRPITAPVTDGRGLERIARLTLDLAQGA